MDAAHQNDTASYTWELVRNATRQKKRMSYSFRNATDQVQAHCVAIGKRDVAYGSLKYYMHRAHTQVRLAMLRGEPEPLFDVAARMALINSPRSRRPYCDSTRRNHDRLLLDTGHWEVVSRNVYRWHTRPFLAPLPEAPRPLELSRSIVEPTLSVAPAEPKQTIPTIYAATEGGAPVPVEVPPGPTPAEIDEVESEWLGPLPALGGRQIVPCHDVNEARAHLARLAAQEAARPDDPRLVPDQPDRAAQQSAPRGVVVELWPLTYGPPARPNL